MLQDKSLLRWSPDGRYHLHELLRQYAAEALASSADDLTQTQDLHCAYYCDFLGRREQDLIGPRQLEATLEIEAELKNIRAAWDWAVQHSDTGRIKKAAFALGNFYQFQSRYLEGSTVFEQASTQLLNRPEAVARELALSDTLIVRSRFYLRFGRLDDIERVSTESQFIQRRLGIDRSPGYVTDPEVVLASADLVGGDYAAAARHARAIRSRGERQDHQGNQMFANFLLARHPWPRAS